MLECLRRIPPFIYVLILTVFGVVGANLYLAFRANSTERDLVRDDYYEAGLLHDQVVNAERQADSVGLNLEWVISNSGWNAIIQSSEDSLLSDLDHQITRCEAFIYRPSDRKLDRSISFSAQISEQKGKRVWNAPLPKLMPGYWHVTLRWFTGNRLLLEKNFKHHATG